MDPDEWHKAHEEYQERMRQINLVYQARLRMFEAHKRAANFWLTGYGVMLLAWVLTGNRAVLVAAVLVICVMVVGAISFHVCFKRLKYPGE